MNQPTMFSNGTSRKILNNNDRNQVVHQRFSLKQ